MATKKQKLISAAKKQTPKGPAERIAEALEEIASRLRSIDSAIESGIETLDMFRKEMWSIEKAIRGEHREGE